MNNTICIKGVQHNHSLMLYDKKIYPIYCAENLKYNYNFCKKEKLVLLSQSEFSIHNFTHLKNKIENKSSEEGAFYQSE